MSTSIYQKGSNSFQRINRQRSKEPQSQAYQSYAGQNSEVNQILPHKSKNLCDSSNKLHNQSIQFLINQSVDSSGHYNRPSNILRPENKRPRDKGIPLKKTQKPVQQIQNIKQRRFKSINSKKGYLQENHEQSFQSFYKDDKIRSRLNNLSFSQNHNNFSYNNFHAYDVSYLPEYDDHNISNFGYQNDMNWLSKHSLAEKNQESIQQFKNEKRPLSIKGDYEVAEGKKLFAEGKTNEAKLYIYLNQTQRFFEKAIEINPDHPEGRYLIGVSYFSNEEFDKAMENFQHLIKQNISVKKNAYILMAIIYKKRNDLEGSLQIVINNFGINFKLSQALQNYPRYYDAYIYRGKLYVRQKKWERGLEDFNQAIKLQPNKAIGYIGQAETFKFLQKSDQAIQAYSQAIQCEDLMKSSALIKRAILYIEMKKYQQALDDVNKLLESDQSSSSEALYFKGLILSKIQNIQEAILCYEQAIKHNNSRKAVTKSIYEIARIKIEQRDYYEAFHQLCRADLLDVDKKALEKFRFFTDGVTFLMKRKYQEGLDFLTNLVENFPMNDFLKPLIYQYRAYGYICIGKYKKALADFQTVEKTQQLDEASKYNKLICQGIITSSENSFEQALNNFVKAAKLVPNKMEPYFYRAMTLIRFSNKLIQAQNKQKHFIVEALKYLNKAVEINDQNANLYFYRGVILLYLNSLDTALSDLEKAIDKSEDNVAKHFYIRGLIYFQLENYKSALNDFAIAINLNENYIEAFLCRARTFYALGDRGNAYYDAKKVTQIKNADDLMLQNAAGVYFLIGAFDDAVKIYSNLIVTSKNPKEILFLRVQCFIQIKELNNALADLEKIMKQSNDPKAISDFQMLQSLKTTTSQTKPFSEAAQQIDQIIQQGEGNIFKLSDILLYKSVYLCFSGDYANAFNIMKQSFTCKQKEILKNTSTSKPKSEFIPLDTSMESSNLDKKEISYDESYNDYEFQYNMSILDIQLGNVQLGIQRLKQLCENIPFQEIKEKLKVLIDLLSGKSQPLGNIEIQVFLDHNRLCSIFPALKLKVNENIVCESRLFFCLPKIQKPSGDCKLDEKFWQSLCPNVVENKPEAPWIKRNADGVVFTDDLQYVDDLDLKSEKTQREKDENKENFEDELNFDEDVNFQEQFKVSESQEQIDNQFDQYFKDISAQKQSITQINEENESQRNQKQVKNEGKYDPIALKQQLMLDGNIASKLEKLLKK